MYIPFFKQQDNWDCSIACVAMISEYFHKKNLNYHELINKTNFYQDLNLIEIEELGKKMNLTLISYFVKWEEFWKEKIKNPIICQVKNDSNFHFIVIFKKDKNKLLIANPEKEESEWIEKEELQKIYTNVILISSSKKFSINELLKEKIGLNFLQKLITPIISLLGIGIVSTILTITLQFLIKIIIDEVLIKKISSQILIFFISFFLIFLVSLIINLIFEKLKFKFEIYYKKKWNLLFFQRLKLLNYINFKKHSLTTILKKYKYFNEIINFYFPNLVNILHNLFFVISSITIIFFFNYWLIFFIILFILIYLVIYIFVCPVFKKIQNKKIENEKVFSNNFLNFIKDQNDLKRRNINLFLNNKINENFDEILKINKKENSLQIFSTSTIDFIKFLSNLFIIYLLISITNNNIKIGHFLFLMTLSKNTIDKSLNSFFYYNEWIKIEKFKKIINPFLRENKKDESPIIWKNKNEINLKNINFSFDKNNYIWKKNLNINIKENTLIDGESGIGKTTLLQLILNEFKPSIGSIKINKNFNTSNSNLFKKEITFITNNSKIIDGSILSNIFNFKETKNNLKKFFDYKLNIWLEEVNLKIFDQVKNKNISSGQKQIIVFLSLFFNESKIILLDECLNSVPNEISKNLFNFFIKKNKNKLILVVTHKENIKNILKNKIKLNE